MEVYFKDLISGEESLDKLVDDLALVVQGENLSETSLAKINSLLERLKGNYQSLKTRTTASAQATDRFVRENPYAFVGAGIVVGFLAGLLVARRR